MFTPILCLHSLIFAAVICLSQAVLAVPAFKKPAREILRQKLSPMQYRVTQENGTEPAFENPYWNNKQPGIYVDILTNEPLFSSLDQFDSGTGWPSFWRALKASNIVEKKEGTVFSRTEVRSKKGDNHLGHVFDDGPAPTGLRYCINSAALRFVPVTQLRAEGFGPYLRLFEGNVRPVGTSQKKGGMKASSSK